MKFIDIANETYSSLSANKVRSGLTMLGIVIGIASVIAMVSIGNGAKASIQSSIEGWGSNLLTIIPGVVQPGRGIFKRFEPNPSMLDCMDAFAPFPMETIAITEAIPITIPSMVRPERTLLAERELYVSFAMSINFIFFYLS